MDSVDPTKMPCIIRNAVLLLARSTCNFNVLEQHCNDMDDNRQHFDTRGKRIYMPRSFNILLKNMRSVDPEGEQSW